MVEKIYDVLVAGGGPAGMVAAIAAARNGADTLLIERHEYLGGTATAAMLCNWGAFDNADRRNDFKRMRLFEDNQPWPPELWEGERIIKGIPEEMLIHLQSAGAASKIPLGYISVNPEYVKMIAEQMVTEAGAKILYQTTSISAERAEDYWVIYAHGKSGLTSFRARQVIDASGDADLAVSTGAEAVKGRESDGYMQGVTLVFRVGVVNLRESDIYTNFAGPFKEKTGRSLGCWTPIPLMPGVFAINTQHTTNIDGCSPSDITSAAENGRKQIMELVELYRRYLPGCENIFLIDTAPCVGIRETRRIVGDYVLTEDDVLSARKFPDGICRHAHNVDVHLSNSGIADLKGKGFIPAGSDYHIPYRCLLPKNLDNFLVAGRTLSATHLAAGSARIQSCCMAMGQAAGTAAALAIKVKTTPRLLPIDVLINTLKSQGACI